MKLIVHVVRTIRGQLEIEVPDDSPLDHWHQVALDKCDEAETVSEGTKIEGFYSEPWGLEVCER